MKPENIKANITNPVSGELLSAYRAEAEMLGIGFQTLTNGQPAFKIRRRGNFRP